MKLTTRTFRVADWMAAFTCRSSFIGGPVDRVGGREVGGVVEVFSLELQSTLVELDDGGILEENRVVADDSGDLHLRGTNVADCDRGSENALVVVRC